MTRDDARSRRLRADPYDHGGARGAGCGGERKRERKRAGDRP
jgi:hypothetical protein